MNDSLLWQIRHFVYNHFADTTLPPSVEDTAAHFNISTEEAGEYYKELHNRHAFFPEPETLTIRMANPFSGIPTDFKVHANGKTYYANCAWDMLGIPAALHTDAVIEAVCTESNETVQVEIKNGQITRGVTLSDSEGSLPPKSETLRSQRALPQSDMLLVHFPLPFARWYDAMTSSSPERPCCSSGRKNGLTNGANSTTSNAEKFLRSTKSGNFQNCGITIDCPWIIMDEASSKSKKYSSKQD